MKILCLLGFHKWEYNSEYGESPRWKCERCGIREPLTKRWKE
jgi:hypothetical protein